MTDTKESFWQDRADMLAENAKLLAECELHRQRNAEADAGWVKVRPYLDSWCSGMGRTWWDIIIHFAEGEKKLCAEAADWRGRYTNLRHEHDMAMTSQPHTSAPAPSALVAAAKAIVDDEYVSHGPVKTVGRWEALRCALAAAPATEPNASVAVPAPDETQRLLEQMDKDEYASVLWCETVEKLLTRLVREVRR